MHHHHFGPGASFVFHISCLLHGETDTYSGWLEVEGVFKRAMMAREDWAAPYQLRAWAEKMGMAPGAADAIDWAVINMESLGESVVELSAGDERWGIVDLESQVEMIKRKTGHYLMGVQKPILLIFQELFADPEAGFLTPEAVSGVSSFREWLYRHGNFVWTGGEKDLQELQQALRRHPATLADVLAVQSPHLIQRRDGACEAAQWPRENAGLKGRVRDLGDGDRADAEILLVEGARKADALCAEAETHFRAALAEREKEIFELTAKAAQLAAELISAQAQIDGFTVEITSLRTQVAAAEPRVMASAGEGAKPEAVQDVAAPEAPPLPTVAPGMKELTAKLRKR